MDRLVEALMPRELREEDRESTRFTIRAWLWATPFLCVFSLLYLVNEMHTQRVVQSFTIGLEVLLLGLLKAGVRPRVVQHASLATMILSFLGTALGQSPFDPSNIFFVSIVPLVATYVFGFRGGAVWAVISIVTGVITLQLGARGVVAPEVDHDLPTTMSLNFVFLTVLSLVYARASTAERELSLSRARAADRAKSVFLANVSHEIRTPMNGVVGMTEVMLQGELTQVQREQLDVIKRSGQALVLLINDLLDLARLEEGRLALDVVSFDLRVLVSDLVTLYEPLAAAKGVTLRHQVGPEVPQGVRGDALRLRQVLANLLSNAVKFTPHGFVALEVSAEGPRVRFAVVDSGPGISDAVRPRLFRRFEQGDASPSRRAGGTGLGLALSHEFVRLMGGALEHDATYTGGARFTFTVELPLEAAEASAPAKPALPPAGPSTKPVLVVDDNPINLAVARSLIGKAGYHVETATNGREALQAVQQAEWSLVLMDVQMPEMDGLEATRQIRALAGPARELPIVALTASAMPEDVSACKAAGMSDLLLKPLDLHALSAVLSRYARAS